MSAALILRVYAVLMAIGGIWGVLKGSRISLMAGVGSAVLLFLVSLAVVKKGRPAVFVGALLTLALAGNFIRSYITKGNFIPNGLFGIVSVVVLLLLGYILTRPEAA